MIGRTRELDAIGRFLDLFDDRPAALVFEGDPGIGKTTLVRAAADAARERGARVLSCAPGASETRLSYAALADLLAEVGEEATGGLPAPQRTALEAALLRAGPGVAGADRRAVATGLLSLLEELATAAPVVVAIDDVQWLDQPTARALEFAARRLAGPVGVIGARRVRADGVWTTGSIEMGERGHSEVVTVGAFGAADLGALLRQRTDARLSAPVLARVHEISGGNPFYALELVRALPPNGPGPGTIPLPASLDEIVAARVAGLGEDVENAVLTVAALADPTVALAERALGDEVLELLEQAETRGVLEFDGARLRFTHPLLAHGVYERASGARRRALHRVLSEVVDDPEERARHLAYAGVVPDAIDALDEAARHVRARGAPDAAGELLELAVSLGGPQQLRVRAAEHYSDAGDPRRAEALLLEALDELTDSADRAEVLLLLGEIRYRDDSYGEAHALLEQARAEPGAGDRAGVQIDLRLAYLLHNVGRFDESHAAARSALAAAERLADPSLLGQTLAMSVITEFTLGRGLDEARLTRALALHDPDLRAPGELRPAHIASFLYRWTGRLDEARELLELLAREEEDRGEEHDLAWLGMWRVLLECMAGDLARAAALAEEAVERLLRLDTPNGRAIAMAIRTQVAAHLGRPDEARRAADEAFAVYEKAPWELASLWLRAILGYLELSLGRYDAAAAALAPLAPLVAGRADPTAGEMFFQGDVAEALVAVGRVDEAEPIVAWLQERGATLDRAWAIAVGGRCRGLILAAHGDVTEAEAELERALLAHDRLPMPIERARTLLALGRVRRRLRKRRAAKAVLDEALQVLQTVGSPRWAEQVSAEIDCLGLRPRASDDLTPSEERVASLAAAGRTNREVAASLGVSPKTVEAHVARVYRKLGVRSRAELGARMADYRAATDAATPASAVPR